MADDNDAFVERTIGDWTAYQEDDGGGIYYHNAETGESSWDAPPGFEDGAAESGHDGDGNGTAGDGGGRGGVDDSAREEFGGAQTPPLDGDANDYSTRSPVYPQSPPMNDGIPQSPPMDDGITQSPPMDDGITQSPPMDDVITQSPPTAGGITRSPPVDDGNTRSPPMDDGITRSPPMDDGITRSPPMDDGISKSPPLNDDAADVAEEEVNGAVDGEEIGNGWVAYKDEEGRIYYYNADTEETQWDRPDVDDTAELPKKTTGTSPGSSPRPKSPAASGGYSPKDEDDKMDAEPSTPEEEPENAVVTAENFLLSSDAVMEPNVLDHINILVQELGPQVAGPKAMQSLMNGYGGDTAVCGLMGLWLADLKSMGGSGRASGTAGNKGGLNNTTNAAGALLDGSAIDGQKLFQTGANVARDVVEEVVNRLAKERFTKDGGDDIMKLSKKEAAFIDKMIASERWRKLLIDLSATTTNKDSTISMYCLTSISNLGHHREIANRINQSDYFNVFNSMFQSELSIAAQISVDGYTKEVDSMDTGKGSGPMMMDSLIADLRRTCTSTSYTYLYAMDVLKNLLSKTNKLISKDGKEGNHLSESSSLMRAMRKWERLREELEDEMLKPINKGTTFQRKRRIDVALTMSDLFHRKRQRMDPRIDDPMNKGDNDNSGNNISSKNDLADALDVALSQLLTKNSLGVQIDKEVAENLLKFAYGGSTDRIGDLLIQHPTAVTALLHNLFGSKRIRQLETRLKCARLVALAVTASERRAAAGASSIEGEETGEVAESSSSEDVLSQVILKGSQLCEQIENMVSFTVLDNVENDTVGSSVGRQLCAMCIKHSVVAQGVLTWAKELSSKSDFVTLVSYPTISPCILSLARLICRHHPLTRTAVLDISLVFMGHSNREISHQKMQSIKEQCLRLMLWLTTQGLSLAVISAVQNKLETGNSGSSEMDSALVRYFFTGILEIVRPPLSLAFFRALGGLMMKKPFADALQSKHFEDSKRGQIFRLIDLFEAATTGKVQKIVSWEEDESLLTMLKSMYCASKN